MSINLSNKSHLCYDTINSYGDKERSMAEEQYQIRMRNGYHKKLRFHFAPVSPAIMNADADWLYDGELAVSYLHTRKLVYPFIKKYYPGEFHWNDELNPMPFENAQKMAKQLRKVARLLEDDYLNPRLKSYRKLFSIDLLVSKEEYDEKYDDAPSYVKEQAVQEHIGVATQFYRKLASWILTTIEVYEPEGCDAIAIWAPR